MRKSLGVLGCDSLSMSYAQSQSIYYTVAAYADLLVLQLRFDLRSHTEIYTFGAIRW